MFRPTPRPFHLQHLICLILLLASSALAASLDDAIKDTRTQIRERIAPKVPGLSIAIGRDGKILWSEGFGYADLETKKPVTPQTLFRIGSISKPLTAAGLMLLVEHGQLDLDTDIHQYVHDFPDKGQCITTRQLAGHLAGISRGSQGKELFINQHFATVRDGVKLFEDDPLLSKPGEKFSYSSHGWSLISWIMESAAKKDFLTYMEKAVFTPLEMTNTMPDYANRDIPQRTQFYDTNSDGGFKLSPTIDNSYKWAAGGFLSTPEDLVRFGSMHLHPGFFKAQTLDTMFTSQKTTDGKPTGYGIGWYLMKDKQGHPIFMHTGGSIGGTSVLLLFPDTHLVLALTANCTSTPFDKTNLATLATLTATFATVPVP
ncbi:serine hydrolase domain-containing protein [Pedosphaera parvula]|uniref:Beta-lactamase n=1 Tax=Pedosphaera parvula (strain Ellin514) TaxID=320771 RepID=B9XQP6_PEDPL|nr:serine hydrolase domain-containing protein [Pedosphaera parvula]EEF57828.1 beta-lactamase [Pedosphaera parvula Ellin514]